MRRPFLALACFALAARLEAAPIVRTISGSPLTIDVGDDTSMQVYDGNDSGLNQFNPRYCAPGQTGDSGVFVSLGGVVYGPDFRNHPCFSAANTYTPWTTVSISSVTGSGSPADPFTVVVVADAGTTGLRLSETLTYVNRSSILLLTFAFSNNGAATVTWDTFLGVDLSGLTSDGGGVVFPILRGGAPGGRAAEKLGAPFPLCFQLPYEVLLPAADRYSANFVYQMWNEISSGSLSNSLGIGCPSSGIATEWTGRTLNPGGTLTINTSGISFANFQAPVAPVPTLSIGGLAALILSLAVAGYLLARRTSLGP